MKRGLSNGLLLIVALAGGACSDDAERCSGENPCEPGGASSEGGRGGREAHGGSDAGGAGDGGNAQGGGGGGGGVGIATVHLTVLDYRDEPIIAFDVISNDADGLLVDQGVTGVDGSADLQVPSGGSVSVVSLVPFPEVSQDYVERHIDTLFFDDSPPAEARIRVVMSFGEVTTETMSVTASLPPRPGASTYEFISTCSSAYSSTSSTQTHSVRGCTDDGTFDIVVVALGASGLPIDYAWSTGNIFTANGTLTRTMSWEGEGPVTTHVSVVNIPTNSPSIAVGVRDTIEHVGWSTSFSRFEEFPQPSGAVVSDWSHLAGLGTLHCDIVNLTSSLDGTESMTSYRCASSVAPTFEVDASRLSRFRPEPPESGPLKMNLVESWSGELGDALGVDALIWDGSTYTIWDAYRGTGSDLSFTFPEMPPELAEFAMAGEDVLVYTSVHLDVEELASFEQLAQEGMPLYGLTAYERTSTHVDTQ